MRLLAIILALCLSACATGSKFIPMSPEQSAQHKALAAEYTPKLDALIKSEEDACQSIDDQIEALYDKRRTISEPIKEEHDRIEQEFYRKNSAIYAAWRAKK